MDPGEARPARGNASSVCSAALELGETVTLAHPGLEQSTGGEFMGGFVGSENPPWSGESNQLVTRFGLYSSGISDTDD